MIIILFIGSDKESALLNFKMFHGNEMPMLDYLHGASMNITMKGLF